MEHEAREAAAVPQARAIIPPFPRQSAAIVPSNVFCWGEKKEEEKTGDLQASGRASAANSENFYGMRAACG